MNSRLLSMLLCSAIAMAFAFVADWLERNDLEACAIIAAILALKWIALAIACACGYKWKD